MTDLDPLLAALRQRPAHSSLSQLEPAAWAAIEEAQTSARLLWGWRAAVAAAMLTLGVVAGGASPGRPMEELAPFSVDTAFAPSTLLESLR